MYKLSYRVYDANSNARYGGPVGLLRCEKNLEIKISKDNDNGGLMPKFEKHIFICGNQRPVGHPRGCCDPSAEAKLQKLFKQKLAQRGLKGRVRANQSGCLDQCEHGPNIVVYPEAVWYGHVTEADVDEIIDAHIVGGKPVERLRLADSCLNTESCEHRRGKS